MLRKDKALLESLTRKYGKDNIIHEIANEAILRAINKATSISLPKQLREGSNCKTKIN